MNELNIVTLLGSGNGTEGNTGKIVTAVLNSIMKEQPNLIVNNIIFTIRDMSTEYCLGCKSCFTKGVCPLDELDSLSKIKKELLKANLVILSSPVYSGHISGCLKNLIDRLSYWTHLMELAGKVCIIVVTAQGNGIAETANYLFEIASFLGMSVLGVVYKSTLYPMKAVEQQIILLLTRLNYYIKEERISSNQFLESKFLGFKKIYKSISQKNKQQHYEASLWEKRNYLKLQSFQELIEMKK